MRIAFLTTEFPVGTTRCGGLGSYLGRVSRALVERGHEAHIILLGEKREEINWQGVLVHVMPAPRLPEGQYDPGWFGRLCRWYSTPAESMRRAWTAFRRVRELHRELQFDVVQIPNIGGMGMLCAAWLSCPVVLRASGFAPLWNRVMHAKRGLTARFLEWMETRSCRKACAVYAPSDLVAVAIQLAGVERVETIRPPWVEALVDEDGTRAAKLAGDMPFLLFFGRTTDKKGALVLAKALADVMPRIADMRAFFIGRDAATVGGGSTIDEVRRTCKPLGERVGFVGEMSQAQLRPFIRRARLVVLPSLVDNLPNACIEAMALGKVVIGTTGTSLDELIEDGVSGFLVEPDDADGLARCIEQVWRRDDLDAIGEAAAERVGTLLDPERTIDALESLYRDCIGKVMG